MEEKDYNSMDHLIVSMLEQLLKLFL